MTLKRTLQAAAAALVLGAAGIASAEVVTITFEGVGNENPVGDYYNGGGGGDLGVSFSVNTLAVVDEDAGGTGNIANEPSASTVMFFLDDNTAILNYAKGFTGGFSFFYSSSTAAVVRVFDALGKQLGSIDLTAQYNENCTGDTTGDFCNFTAVGVAFAGTATSISFSGTANQVAFDNITFGSDTPGCTVNCNPIPEPATLALVGAALLGLSAGRRRRA